MGLTWIRQMPVRRPSEGDVLARSLYTFSASATMILLAKSIGAAFAVVAHGARRPRDSIV